MSKEQTKVAAIKPKGLNVFGKISAIQAELGAISKNGRNAFQNYDYMKESDIVNAINPLMVKHGVVMIPNTGGATVHDLAKGKLTMFQMQFKIVNVDDPEDYTTIMTVGQGSDNGDKGAYKAMTGAKKYALMQTFMIATDDDPEKDSSVTSKVKSVKPSTKSDF